MRYLIVGIIFLAAVAGAVWFYIDKSRAPFEHGAIVTVHGTVECLPFISKNEFHTLDCEKGLKDSEGRFYRLQGYPKRAQPPLTGRFDNHTGGNFDIAGSLMNTSK